MLTSSKLSLRVTAAIAALSCAATLSWATSASAQQVTTTEDGYVPNRYLLTTGLLLWGVPYSIGVVQAAESSNSANQHLYVPIVGPWIDLGRAHRAPSEATPAMARRRAGCSSSATGYSKRSAPWRSFGRSCAPSTARLRGSRRPASRPRSRSSRRASRAATASPRSRSSEGGAMATIDKNGVPRTTRPHRTGTRTIVLSLRHARGKESVASRATKLGDLSRAARDLPGRIEARLKSDPVGTLVAFGAGCFVLGALFGSRLGRLAIVTALPYAIERVFAVAQTPVSNALNRQPTSRARRRPSWLAARWTRPRSLRAEHCAGVRQAPGEEPSPHP